MCPSYSNSSMPQAMWWTQAQSQKAFGSTESGWICLAIESNFRKKRWICPLCTVADLSELELRFGFFSVVWAIAGSVSLPKTNTSMFWVSVMSFVMTPKPIDYRAAWGEVKVFSLHQPAPWTFRVEVDMMVAPRCTLRLLKEIVRRKGTLTKEGFVGGHEEESFPEVKKQTWTIRTAKAKRLRISSVKYYRSSISTPYWSSSLEILSRRCVRKLLCRRLLSCSPSELPSTQMKKSHANHSCGNADLDRFV